MKDGRRFPEIACKCSGVFLEYCGVLQEWEAASVRGKRSLFARARRRWHSPLFANAKASNFIASNVYTMVCVCVWVCECTGMRKEVSARQFRRFIYSTILRIDGSFILLPSRTEAWLCLLQRLHLLPLHDPTEANTQWSQPWPHHPVTLFYSAQAYRLDVPAVIVSGHNRLLHLFLKKFLNYGLFYIQVGALQASGLRRISQTQHSTHTVYAVQREREQASVIHARTQKAKKPSLLL